MDPINKNLVAIALIFGSCLMLIAWTGMQADGQALILKAPDGHCAEVVLADNNTVSWGNVTCP